MHAALTFPTASLANPLSPLTNPIIPSATLGNLLAKSSRSCLPDNHCQNPSDAGIALATSAKHFNASQPALTIFILSSVNPPFVNTLTNPVIPAATKGNCTPNPAKSCSPENTCHKPPVAGISFAVSDRLFNAWHAASTILILLSSKPCRLAINWLNPVPSEPNSEPNADISCSPVNQPVTVSRRFPAVNDNTASAIAFAPCIILGSTVPIISINGLAFVAKFVNSVPNLANDSPLDINLTILSNKLAPIKLNNALDK